MTADDSVLTYRLGIKLKQNAVKPGTDTYLVPLFLVLAKTATILRLDSNLSIFIVHHTPIKHDVCRRFH